jgi:hypothetical protein
MRPGFSEIMNYKQSRIVSRETCSREPLGAWNGPGKGGGDGGQALRKENARLAEEMANLQKERYMEQWLLRSFARVFANLLEDHEEPSSSQEVIDQCVQIIRVIESAEVEVGLKKDTLLFDSLHSTIQ